MAAAETVNANPNPNQHHGGNRTRIVLRQYLSDLRRSRVYPVMQTSWNGKHKFYTIPERIRHIIRGIIHGVVLLHSSGMHVAQHFSMDNFSMYNRLVRMDPLPLEPIVQSKQIDHDFICAAKIIDAILRPGLVKFNISIDALPTMADFLELITSDERGDRQDILVHNLAILSTSEIFKFIAEAKSIPYRCMYITNYIYLMTDIASMIRSPWLKRVPVPIASIDDFDDYKERNKPFEEVDEAYYLLCLLRNFLEHYHQMHSRTGRDPEWIESMIMETFGFDLLRVQELLHYSRFAYDFRHQRLTFSYSKLMQEC